LNYITVLSNIFSILEAFKLGVLREEQGEWDPETIPNRIEHPKE